MTIALTDLASNSDIFGHWEDQQTKNGFGIGIFYTTFDSPQTWLEQIERSKKNRLRKSLNGKTLETSEMENNKVWEFIIKDEAKKITHPFYIGISNNVWTVFTDRKSDFKKLFENLVKYSSGISHAWVSPSQMSEIINEYAKIGTLQVISKSPSFKIPSRAPIPARVREELPDAFFKKMSATVQFWAPREIIYSDDPFSYNELRISKDYLNKITKLFFSTKFDNPGKSKISVDNDSIVSHESGMPEATEIVFNSVFKSAASWIDKVKDCIAEFEIRCDDRGEILNLYCKKRPKEMYFSIKDETIFSTKHLIKLEQILISGSSETELIGYRISSDNNTISVRTMYPRFCQDALIDLTLEDGQIQVLAFPYSNTGPHILSKIYRAINETFAWSIGSIEVRNRWE